MRGLQREGPRDFQELVHRRHSVREFLPRPVSHAQITAVLEAARRAPSAGNLQAYRILVVEDRECRAEVAEAAGQQAFIADAPVVLVFCADAAVSAAEYGTRGAELYAVQDATIACAYAQLAVAAVGLGCVWIGAFNEDAVRSAIGIDRELRPVALLPIGHAGKPGQTTPRRPLVNLVEYLDRPTTEARRLQASTEEANHDDF